MHDGQERYDVNYARKISKEPLKIFPDAAVDFTQFADSIKALG
jgi:hypothetical protein